MTISTAPEIVRRYFELASSSDSEAYFALFAADPFVEDEGEQYAGIDAIRARRTEVPPGEYTITDIEQSGDAVVVTCAIAGGFPGSPFAGLRLLRQGCSRNTA